MASRDNGKRSQGEEQTKRQQREQRILDVAAELVQRWGYNKTTIDDIARSAGVAKGTIYLHWKTREELFKALMDREKSKLAEDIKQRVARDPEGKTLHGLMRQTLLATMQNPLMKAELLQDREVLGNMAHMEQGTPEYAERIADFNDYFQLLRRQGMVRTDLGHKEETYILGAVTLGFFIIDSFLPDEFKLSNETAAELLAETVRCTFEPRAPVSAEAVETAGEGLEQYLERYIDRKASLQ